MIQSEKQNGCDGKTRACVTQSLDFGLTPFSAEELFEQHWSKSEISFDDFSDESETEGAPDCHRKVKHHTQLAHIIMVDGGTN